MTSIFHLVYLSKAAEDISYTDILEILEASRKHNAKEGVTGLLVFRDGYFLQLLEGEEPSVQKILKQIKEDSRNKGLKIITETRSNARLFQDWAMAFHDGDIPTESNEDLIVLFEACLEKGEKAKALVMPLLTKFRDSAPILK